MLRFIGRTLLEIVFEFLIQGIGYMICRVFKRDVDPDSFAVALVGILFWMAIGGAGYAIYCQL